MAEQPVPGLIGGERRYDQVASIFDIAPEGSNRRRGLQRRGGWDDDERIPAENAGLRGRFDTQRVCANPEPMKCIEDQWEDFAARRHVPGYSERSSLVEFGDHGSGRFHWLRQQLCTEPVEEFSDLDDPVEVRFGPTSPVEHAAALRPVAALPPIPGPVHQ